MNVAVITLFPEMFSALCDYGITGRAVKDGLVNIAFFNPREFTTDKHQTVDDRPYGGGPGMVMKVEPLKKALDSAMLWHDKLAQNSQDFDSGQAGKHPVKVVYMSPQGKVLNHAALSDQVQSPDIVLIAGRYEGVDQRFIDRYVDEQWSIGDFVLSGGELPCMVMLDAIIRKLPGAIGASESHEQDSFENGLLDYPHYTRPESIAGLDPKLDDKDFFCDVPDILLSGNHSAIEQWRKEQALLVTATARPDLLEGMSLSQQDYKILAKK